ncbi:hypothetical protein ABZ745_32605, partial [Streptomyces sp. NPDC013082]
MIAVEGENLGSIRKAASSGPGMRGPGPALVFLARNTWTAGGAERLRRSEVAIPRTERFHQSAPPNEDFEPYPGMLLRT